MSFPTVSIKYINTEQKTSVLEKKILEKARIMIFILSSLVKRDNLPLQGD